MAINQSRDMHAELMEGITDGSVMKLGGGMRGGEIEHQNEERLEWPTYAGVERRYPDTTPFAR